MEYIGFFCREITSVNGKWTESCTLVMEQIIEIQFGKGLAPGYPLIEVSYMVAGQLRKLKTVKVVIVKDQAHYQELMKMKDFGLSWL